MLLHSFLALVSCEMTLIINHDNQERVVDSFQANCNLTDLNFSNVKNITIIGGKITEYDYGNTSTLFPQLKYLVVKNSVKTENIPESAFFNCSSLEIVNIEATGEYGVEDLAFSYCTKLKYGYFPNAKYFGNSAFMNSHFLLEISSEHVSKIGGMCFMNCHLIKDIRLPKVTELSPLCFANCFSLERFTDFDNIIKLGRNCILNCSFRSLVFKNAEEIDTDSIANCYYLSHLEMNNLKQIPDCLFSQDNVMDNLYIVKFNGIKNVPSKAFYNRKSIQYAYFKNATVVGKKAFSFCVDLISIDLDSVEEIQESGFEYCTSLETVAFPNLLSVERNAFDSCITLTNVNFPKLITINEQSFLNCRFLKETSFPSVEKIWMFAFKGCLDLTDLVLDNVVFIDPYVFNGADNLQSISLNSLSFISIEAFCDLMMLTNISIPKVENIFEEAFSNCYSLKNIIANNVKRIDNYAFSNCFELPNVILEWDKLNFIGDGVFLYCSNIDNLTSSSITEIGSSCFAGTPVKTIDLPNLVKAGSKFLAGTNIHSIKNLDSLVEVNQSCFMNCYDLENVSLKISKSGAFLFKDCCKLTSVHLEMKELPTSTFENCIALSKVSLPNVEVIGESAFRCCTSLKELELKNLKQIDAFSFFKCSNLTEIDLGGVKENYVLSYAFAYCSNLKRVNVPGLKTISKFMFFKCSNLSDITGCEYWNEIQSGAFEYCSSLKNLDLTNVKTVEASVFRSCFNLEAIHLPYLNGIETTVFKDCISLKEIFLPEVDFIQYMGFYNCSSLNKIELPNLRMVVTEAFAYCSSLKEVSFPNLFYLENDGVFKGCYSLENVSMYSLINVSSALNIFKNCNSLKRIDLPSNEPYLFSDNFLNSSGIMKKYISGQYVYPITLCLPYIDDYQKYKGKNHQWKQLLLDVPEKYKEICVNSKVDWDEVARKRRDKYLFIGFGLFIILGSIITVLIIIIRKQIKKKNEFDNALHIAISAIDDQ